MLKITESMDGTTAVLTVEGVLGAREACELARACEPHVETRQGVDLDLMQVTFCDDHGLSGIRSLLEKGARVRRCSLFLARLFAEVGS
jgi:hypothetical protein